MSIGIASDSPFAHLQNKSYEWYTPAKYIEAVRQVMDSIDLDPASNELANTVVKATTFYDEQANGLIHPWLGNVWLNPPYCRTGHVSNQEIWTCRLIAQYEAGITTQAVLLVNASTDTGWFQRLWKYPICFTDHRVSFWSANSKQSSPTHGSVFVYFGSRSDRFISVFQRFGSVVSRVSSLDRSLWDEAI